MMVVECIAALLDEEKLGYQHILCIITSSITLLIICDYYLKNTITEIKALLFILKYGLVVLYHV